MIFFKKGYYFVSKKIIHTWPMWFFLFFYSALFFSRLRGAGQYWDANFPYFISHIGNFFSLQSFSWVSTTGEPLKYSSDYFFRFVISNFSFLQPEYLLYGIYVLLFSLGSFGVFRIMSKNVSVPTALMASLAVMLSPAMFSKFIAGHLVYLVSFVMLIHFIYYLMYSFKNSFKDYFKLGLFISFIGVSIKFFVFAGIVLVISFLLRPRLFNFRFLPLIFVMPILINMIWLSNFFVGGVSVSELGAYAAQSSWPENMFTDYSRIFNFSFSKATLIDRFYPSFYFSFFSVMVLIILFMGLCMDSSKRKLFFVINIVTFVFLGTGIFNKINIPIVEKIYPMFRNSGHMAPITVLFIFLLWVDFKNIFYRRMSQLLLCIFIIVNGFQFFLFPESLNFSKVRNQFSEFEVFKMKNDIKERVLTYPSFGQYGFIDEKTFYNNKFRLNNTAYDSYITYSGLSYIKYALTPEEVHLSIPYALLKTNDVRILDPFNIRYLFDFSDIYESYYNQYVPADAYDNDLSIIKNNDLLFDRLIEKSEGALVKISDHIYELKSYEPYINSFKNLYSLRNLSYDDNEKRIVNSDSHEDFYFTVIDNTKRGDSLIDVHNIFEGINFKNLNVENKSIYNIINGPSNKKIQLHVNGDSEKLHKNIFLNGERLLEEGIFLKEGENVFEYRDDTLPFINIIQNSSFQDGTWQEEVGDCSNFDERPILDMKLNTEEKTIGKNSLQLEATHHVACTSTSVPIKRGKQYMFGFDYQSPNTKEASYYLGFNDQQKTIIKERISIEDMNWHTFFRVINVPEDATMIDLYVYANSLDGKTNIINRYDNFKLIETLDLSDAYYLVSEPEVELREPASITFDIINPTKKLVHIHGATTPFYLAMSESYHPQWQAQMNNEKINGFFNSWVPFVRPDQISSESHYKLNGFLNGWYVDTQALCQSNSACTQNPDGSYDIEMTLEFFPQRWFYLGLLISGTTFLACLGYLLYIWREKLRKIFLRIKSYIRPKLKL